MRRALSRKATFMTTAVLMAGLFAGCSGGNDEATPETNEATSTPSESAETPAPPETWPLTGLEAAEGQSTAKNVPVLVTKIDNTTSSAPQMGLGKADMVVEELVEGGTTRLAAFFYSELPDVVGPVRSMRASDIGIVSPVNATVITSGAAQVTKNRINAAGIPFFEEGAKGFFRESSRYAPYNLMARPKEVATLAKGEEARPDDYFTFGDPADLPAGRKATTVSANFGRHTTTWTFANGGYVNQGSFAGQGDEFAATSVLVLRVRIGDAGYADPAGNVVPETIFQGTGAAQLFHDGRVISGTWEKKELDAPLTLQTRGGELKMPPGNTFVELVPQDTGSVVFTK